MVYCRCVIWPGGTRAQACMQGAITPLSMFLCLWLWRSAGRLPEKPVQTPRERQGREGRKGEKQCCKQTGDGAAPVRLVCQSDAGLAEGCLAQLPGMYRRSDSLLPTYIIFPSLRFITPPP